MLRAIFSTCEPKEMPAARFTTNRGGQVKENCDE